mmetsp:Transcript_18400/g.31463  ORF Transcript_18400/g.31463 Transcript_18400/m.31463 type:complete len:102 (+) Transcript_18400:630-935(+)
MVALIADHSLPLITLLIDYTFNSIPFVNRHFSMIGAICAIYMLVNYLYTQIAGKPVYYIMNWQWPTGVIVPILTVLVGVLLFFLITFLNTYRIKLYSQFRN